MISPHTAPGTKVVCINAQDCEGYLFEGTVYTLRAWRLPDPDVPLMPGEDGLPGVILEEVDLPPGRLEGLYKVNSFGYHPRRFRVAALPKVLTDLLITEMV